MKPNRPTRCTRTATYPRPAWCWLALVACALLLAVGPVASAARPDEDTVRLMNRGVGMMEQYRFLDATAAFEEVVERAPDWATAYVNLGIAHLNAVSDPDRPEDVLELAKEAFRRAAELDPSLPHPHYCLGLLARYSGDADAAMPHFERVLEIDPHNADSLHFIGTLYMSLGEPAVAATYYRRAVDESPYLLSAHYSYAQALIRQGLREEAMARLEVFQQLDAAKVGSKRAMVYREMGHYADAVRVFPAISDPWTPDDVAVAFVIADIGLQAPGSIATVDMDGDGDLDAWISSGDDGLAFFENADDGFEQKAHRAERSSAAYSVPGDFDNDGDADLAVATGGSLRVLRNDGDLGFSVAHEALTPDTTPTLTAWVDADHEGDLDLLVTHSDGVALLRNNGNGTFTDVTADSGLPASGLDFSAAALADFDDDDDVDFLLVSHVGPRLYSNDRLNRWSDVTAGSGLRQGPGGTHVLSADFDKDGHTDVLLLRGSDRPAEMYRNNGHAAFELYEWVDQVRAKTATVLDVDNDGDLDIFTPSGRWGDESGPRPLLLANDGRGRFGEVACHTSLDGSDLAGASGSVGADIDNDGDTDLLIARAHQHPLFIRNDGGNANNWLHLDLVGAMAAKSGYGAKVEIKSSSLWQKIEHHMIGGPGAASNPRIEIGLGYRNTADFVRIIWPNGVLQSELEIAANQVRSIPEVERKASSCPILFAWNGEHFEFITDFMGVGGLGYFVAPHVTGTPDPTERVKIEHGQIAPIGGEYLLRVVEPMEEIAYVDEIKLLAVDHPAGTEVYPDERLALDGHLPTERIYCYDRRIYPMSASDHAGRNVLPRILERDRRYPHLERDDRFLGHLTEEHSLEVEFGDRLEGLDASKPWILYVHGWIEYPYSHTVYAALQADVVGEGLHVDVRRPDGAWEAVRPNAGYPAGMPKMMTLDMSDYMSPGTTALRLRTNLEIYVDELYIAEDMGESGLRVSTLTPSSAQLHHTGYPRESSPDGRMPRLYDYSSIDRSYAFKNMAGPYTRFGDVRALLEATDDQYVIMGRGEEIALGFTESALPDIPGGHVRSLILHTDGFCKDMDPYTAYPNTVGPLPFHAMTGYPYAASESYPDDEATRAYLDAFQTRAK